ncbi:MAG: glycine--tRNA ligase subunit beta [Burkholderiales bacterium]|nr:glycine--tRNA ligase subunit beta [Burkholderiales bacterium]
MQTELISAADLLCEFLTEELPPIDLEKNIGESFARNLTAQLSSFIPSQAQYHFFVTPRRFGCIINQVAMVEPEQKLSKRGPAIATALNNNMPTNALLGFVKACGINSWQDLEQKEDGYFYAQKIIPGRKLTEVLIEAINVALKKLPIAKNMRWGNHSYHFVRPVHNLVLMWGNSVICADGEILGCSPVNYTFGHRVMSQGKLVITQATTYMQQMLDDGRVYADFARRREYIVHSLHNAADSRNLVICNTPGLLDEVTALVEYPVILCGEFSSSFLNVPQECLILSMAKHQKYFALRDDHGNLTNKFLCVANIDSANPEVIIKGNQKVLAARLGDAKFFYETDLKQELSKFAQKLDTVIYHHLLGTQLERIHRLQNIASQIAPTFNLTPEIAHRTALLIKADLTTEMVNEFPELQGVMGKYYAIAQGESIEVAHAIEHHYYPRFSGDQLPDTPLATLMSLSDKLEILIGIWGIGLIPTGEKDPFGLRRAALAVVRILLREPLNILNLLQITHSAFVGITLNSNVIDEVYQFIMQRLANYLISVEKYPVACVNSILAIRPVNFNYLISLLDILQNFAQDSTNQSLLEANKRIRNIIDKNNISFSNLSIPIQIKLFTTIEEHNLYSLLTTLEEQIKQHALNHNWQEFFLMLSQFNQPITAFFKEVMVMDENMEVRTNRIILLLTVYKMLNQVCELSELI